MSRNHRSIRYALVLAAAAIIGAVLGARHFARTKECGDGPARRLGAWNQAMRSAVKASFTGVPWSSRMIDGFDRASSTWEASYHTACTAHDAKRVQCLDEALDRIRTLATHFAGVSDGHSIPDAPAGQPDRLDAPARLAAPWQVAQLAVDCEHPIVDPRTNLAAAITALNAHDLVTAEHAIALARDRAIDIFGDRHPELAPYDDALADIDRARGKIRAALAMSEQSAQLRGPDDHPTTLYHRALTHLEAGELGEAERAVHRAMALRKDNVADLYAVLAQCDAARGTPDPDHVAKAGPQPQVELGAYRDGLAPATIVAIAQRDHSCELYATALAQLSNEPNRTALAAALGLARCDDPRAGQAARTAVQLYLAMPELDRAQLPLAQELAKKP